MRLEKIYIGAFGGLKDYTLELTDGLNVIYGQNENGKSTIMAFIKMMFYGSGKKQSQISTSPRVRYTPWSGDGMCGRIYFNHKGTRYCLEREFRKSDSTDKITLRNLDLGTSENVESDIGIRFFGLSAAAFEKSNFISVLSVSSKDETAAGELGARLSNLVLTGDESVSYQAVEARLTAAREALISKSAKKGDYVAGCIRLEELRSELSAAKNSATAKAELTAAAEENKLKYNKLKAEYDGVNKTVNQENDIKNAEKLREYLDVKAHLDSLTETLKTSDGKIADEMFVKTARFALNRYEMQAKKVEALSAELKKSEEAIALSTTQNTDELKAEVAAKNDELSALEAKQSAAQSELEGAALKQNDFKSEQKKSSSATLLFIAAALLAVSAILAAIVFWPIAAILLLAAVLMTIGAFGFKARDKKELDIRLRAEAELKGREAELKMTIAEIAEKKNALRERISVINTALNTDAAVRNQRLAELAERKEGLVAEKQKAETERGELLKHFSRYNSSEDTFEITIILDALEGKTEELKAVKGRLAYLARDLGNISYEQAEEKLRTLPDINGSDIDFAAARKRKEELTSALTDIATKTSAILTELKTGFSDTRNTVDIEKEINEATETLAAQKQFYDSAALASEILSESFAEVRRSYGSELEKHAIEIFSRLTGGRYETLNVSKSLDMTVEQRGVFGTRELDYLSSGTADQAYLSLRLAIVELISDGEMLPILLDDVLSQYDDTRADEAMSFLKEYSSATQTLLFTCHNSVCSSAKNKGITIKEL